MMRGPEDDVDLRRLDFEKQFLSAESSYKVRDYSSAEAGYRRCLELEPRSGRAALGLGSVLLRRWAHARREGAPREAIHDLREEAHWAIRSARFFDGDLTCRSLLDEALLVASDDPIAGEELYKQAIESGQDTPLACGAYAEFLGDQRRFEEAERQFEAALALEPALLMNLINYGRLKVRQSEPDLEFAEFLFRRAVDVDPESAEAHYRLGDVLVAFSDCLQEAVEHLERALRLDPGHAKARSVLAEALDLIRLSQAEGRSRQSSAAPQASDETSA